ncbi:MAG: hypothetical protein ACI4JB_03980 [Porcipelethomonas sp.]
MRIRLCEHALIGGAPEALDTLKELADAYQSAADLIAALQIYGVRKKVVYCPDITPVDGVCTWVINHGIGPETADTKAGQIIIQIYDISGNQVACNVQNIVPGDSSIVKFSSTSEISAGAYYVAVNIAATDLNVKSAVLGLVISAVSSDVAAVMNLKEEN